MTWGALGERLERGKPATSLNKAGGWWQGLVCMCLRPCALALLPFCPLVVNDDTIAATHGSFLPV